MAATRLFSPDNRSFKPCGAGNGYSAVDFLAIVLNFGVSIRFAVGPVWLCPRGELKVLGLPVPLRTGMAEKLWRMPKDCRTVPPRIGRAGIENSSRDTPIVQNYTCEVLASAAVKPLDSGFSEGFVSQGIQQHRKLSA